MPKPKAKPQTDGSVISISSESEHDTRNEVVEVSSDESVPTNIRISKTMKAKLIEKSLKSPPPNKRQASDSFAATSSSIRKKAREVSPQGEDERQSRSPSPENAPAVTITNRAGKTIFAASRNRSPTFGKFDELSTNHTPSSIDSTLIVVTFTRDNNSAGDEPQSSPNVRAKRVPVPSEKARYMKSEHSTQAGAERASGSRTNKDKHATQAEEVATPSPRKKKITEILKDFAVDESSPNSRSRKETNVSRRLETSTPRIKKEPDAVDEPTTPIRRANKAPAAVRVKVEPSSPPLTPLASPFKASKTRDARNEKGSHDGGDGVDIKQEKRQIQGTKQQEQRPIGPEPRERPADGLPTPPEQKYPTCILEPFGYIVRQETQNTVIVGPPVLKKLYNGMKREEGNVYGPSNLLRCYVFTSYGGFHNPARADANEFTVLKDNQNNGRIVPADASQSSYTPSTIFMTSGCVSNCDLIKPGSNRTGSENSVKKIGLWVIEGELNPMLAFFGQVFGMKRLWGNFYRNILTFSSGHLSQNNDNNSRYAQGSGAGSSYQGAAQSTMQSSPRKIAKKARGLFGPPDPTMLYSSSYGNMNHPHFLKFTDDVPIYDVRNTEFKVSEVSMGNLRKLPRYMHGISDVPEYAAVTVGYTVNTFLYNHYGNSSPSALSLNIQFVILHGNPEDDEASDDDEETNADGRDDEGSKKEEEEGDEEDPEE